MRRLLTPAALVLAALASGNTSSAAELFSANFNNFTAPPPNFNGLQYQSGLAVAFGGDVPGWSKSGGGAVHAVNLIPPPPPPTPDFAPMIWQDNVITLAAPIEESNALGQTYSVSFLGSAAVYQAPGQATSAGDGLLVEVLRGNGSVLATHTYLPGAWTGTLDFNADAFSYVGDGSGDVRLRVGPSNPNNGRFNGAIDNLTLAGAAELFNASFDDFTAPAPNFNGLQFQSGFPVAHTGDVPGWDKAGAGAVHAVNHATPTLAPPGDFAAMIWQDNVITLDAAIEGSNAAGQSYQVDFDASAAVYQQAAQQTGAEDGVLVEVLRGDGSVLASQAYLPGAWTGSIALDHVSFAYVGDGSGDVRLRVGPSNFNSGTFGGAIDNLTVSTSAVPEPGTLASAAVVLVGAGVSIVRRRLRRR